MGQSAQANAEASQAKNIFAVPKTSEMRCLFRKLSLWDGQETELTRNIY